MDVVIFTVDPEEVDADEIHEALEDIGYFVSSVTILTREEVPPLYI